MTNNTSIIEIDCFTLAVLTDTLWTDGSVLTEPALIMIPKPSIN